MAEPQPLFDYTGHLPECPTWSEAEQALYWADIMECEIHRYDVQKGEHQVLQFPEEPGCLPCARRAVLSSLYAAVSGSLMRMVFYSEKSAITPATRN